jgi:mannosyl-3-phosphoglycerate phosphatase
MNIRDNISGRLVIFTDLDGTLLDSCYSFKDALPALRLIKKRGLPLILCSSKTGLEIEFYRERIENIDPFVSENGGGIYIPKGYFNVQIPETEFQTEENKDYTIIKLGAKYSDLRNAVTELRRLGFDVKGFGDMSVREISRLTGLDTHEARMAKAREFDEPFVFNGGEALLKRLSQSIKDMGFNMTRGVLFHILGESDKGRAVEILKDLYAGKDQHILTIALGDSPNDIEMLQNVDYPVTVQKSNGAYDERIKVRGLIKAKGIGPKGWNEAMLKLLKTLLF